VRTKLTGPQAKVAEVLTLNGVVFVWVAPAAIFGYAEFGWAMTTPGVEVESTPDTLFMLVEPMLTIATFSELHSLRSMMPFPLPAEIVVELTEGLAALGVAGSSLVPAACGAVSGSVVEVVDAIPMPEVALVQPAGSFGALTRSKIFAKREVVSTEESRMELPTPLYRDKPVFSSELSVTLVACALFVGNKSKTGRSKEISAIRRSRVRLFISFLRRPGMDNGSSGKEQERFLLGLARRSLRTLLRGGGQYTAWQQLHETVAFGLRVDTAACQSVITSCRLV
jgi:hypothetical protein